MKKSIYLLLSSVLFSGYSWAVLEHQVQQGDHVIDILATHKYPMDNASQRQHWLDEMMRLNKSKFIWGEIDLIKPGSVLTLPAHPSDKNIAVPTPVVTAEFDSVKRIAEMQVEKGHVNIQSKSGSDRKATGTALIYEGDTLISSDAALAKITMIDQAKFELSARSKMSFERYHYQPKAPEKSTTLTRFYRGAMRATTGLIGKLAPNRFDVRTPVISIGIRGTDYVARHCEGDYCGDYVGSSLAVMEGGVATQTSSGSADVNKGEFVQASISGDLSEVAEIPAGFLDLEKDIADIESPLSWWQKAVQKIRKNLQ